MRNRNMGIYYSSNNIRYIQIRNFSVQTRSYALFIRRIKRARQTAARFAAFDRNLQGRKRFPVGGFKGQGTAFYQIKLATAAII